MKLQYTFPCKEFKYNLKKSWQDLPIKPKEKTFTNYLLKCVFFLRLSIYCNDEIFKNIVLSPNNFCLEKSNYCRAIKSEVVIPNVLILKPFP